MQNFIQNQMINHFNQGAFEAVDKIKNKSSSRQTLRSIFKIMDFEASQKLLRVLLKSNCHKYVKI